MVENKEEKMEKKETEKKTEEKEMKKEDKNTEKKDVEKKEKKIETKVVKKDKAIARGVSLRISPKFTVAICKEIKNKTPDAAIEFLELVVKKKKAVRMPNLEVAHKKGKKTAGGRFPVRAAQAVITVVKQLKANSLAVGIDNPIIFIAKADRASRPYRREGKRAKRAHLYLESREMSKIKMKKKGAN